MDQTTPPGYYDESGVWVEGSFFDSLRREKEQKGNETTEFIEFENLAPDLRGQFRFGIKPEEISNYSAKIRSLLSMQSANRAEILKFRKAQAIATFGKAPNDSGSAGVQVAIMTHEINALNEHMNSHRKDENSRRSLSILVSRRKKMMRYLKSHDPATYWKVLQTLNLREMV